MYSVITFMLKGYVQVHKYLSFSVAVALASSFNACNSGSDGKDGINGVDGQSLSFDNLTDEQKAQLSNNLNAGIKPSKVLFAEVQTPINQTSKSIIQASNKITFLDETQAISFKKLFATGTADNNQIYGLVKDYQNNPIKFSDGSNYICNGTNSGEGSGLDYVSILQKNNKLYMVSQFECAIGAMYINELEQNSSTGELTAKKDSLKFISQKDEFGGFVHCAGQRTPWESHLGSEEYETDARKVESDKNITTGLIGDSYYDELAKFWGNDGKKISPYYYGWTPEVTINSNGEAVYKKHYSMGRFSHELSYVMPDKKTVYMSDDGTNVGLYMYVAKNAGDLSEGVLYSAKWNQNSSANGGRTDITWIKLGEAKDSDIRKLLDPDGNIETNDSPSFSDIFEIGTGDATKGTCNNGFTAINTSGGFECLKIKTGKELHATFLETRRYSAMKGATTEFRKEEGLTFSAEHNKLFVAMSEISSGMEDSSSYDIGGNNHIKLSKNSCGGVYALDVATSTQKDTTGNIISSNYVVNNMYSIINGTAKSYDNTSQYAGNSCDVNNISNPDNLTYLDNSNLLFIGEDSGKHLNNAIWAFDITNGALTRVFTSPLGAETTSPFWYSNINGWGYLTAVTQHPNLTSTEAGESSIGVLGAIKNLHQLNGNKLTKLGSYNSGIEAGSEISAFDSSTKKLFITNGATNKIDVINLSDVQSPKLLTSIDMSSYGNGIQSVAVKDEKVAIAVGSKDKTGQKGKVVILNTKDYSLISQTQVGYLPDMLTFNTDGSKIIIANEGEPIATNGIYQDVEGSVGIITLANTTKNDDSAGYFDLNFSSVNLTNAQDGTSVRLGGTPSNNQSLDIEPEYISIDDKFAYVTLQENNALAKINLDSNSFEFVKSFGSKDYETANKIDIEEYGAIKLKNYQGLKALYMPDAISSYSFGGSTYLVTANEGDGREYLDNNGSTVFIDEVKISKLKLDSTISSSYITDNDLKVLKDFGDLDNDGDYEQLYGFGARSFSIWDDSGNLVWDSGYAFSQLVAKYEPKLFNQDNGEIDGRSGNKGVEPEAITVGVIDGKTYAFIGLERQSAIIIYDISNPFQPIFIDYISTHIQGDVSPEGLIFIPASKSSNGKNLLIVSFEISGSTAIYEINL